MVKKKPIPKNKFLELRMKLNMDQVTMAKRVGIAQGTVSKIENSKIKPSFDYLRGLKREFNIDVNEYME